MLFPTLAEAWLSWWRRRASNRKVAKPWFDSWCGSASLCPWERHLMLFPTLGPSSQLVVVAQPDERHANRAASLLEWYDRHRAMSTTSSSSEEEHQNYLYNCYWIVVSLWWPSLTKDMQTEQLLCWSDMTDTEQWVQHLAQTKKNTKIIYSI